MRSVYTCTLGLLFAFAQKITFAQHINIGEVMPGIAITNVWNYNSDTLRLHYLRGKKIILDFWGFNCTACLQSFTKVDSLQKQFNDRLQILLVNQNSKTETIAFFAKRKKIKIPSVPLLTTDSILHSFFPHTGVPFLVWIDDDGKISYLTDGAYLTISNIQKFLDGIQLNLPLATANTYTPSLFKDQVENALVYFSYIAKCIDRGAFHITGLENALASVNTYYCNSIKDLYQFAYNESESAGPYKFREPGRTILEVADKYKFEYPHDPLVNDKWKEENSYYSHSNLSPERKEERFKIMQQDLQRQFNLEAKIVKRKVSCLVLVRTSGTNKLMTKGGLPARTGFGEDIRTDDSPPIRFLRNTPYREFFDLIKTIGNYNFKVKIIDDTGYTGNIDFEINENLLGNLTVESLREELKKYDLDLVKKQVTMEVLVLKERKIVK